MSAKKLSESQLIKVRKKANHSFFFNSIGTLLPVILGLLAVTVFTLFSSFFNFISDGTICICSASFFTIANYLFAENVNSINKKLDIRLHRSTLILLILSSCLYGYIFLDKNLGITKVKLNQYSIAILSIIFFVISMCAAYRATYLESLNHPPAIDPTEDTRNGINDIMDNIGAQ